MKKIITLILIGMTVLLAVQKEPYEEDGVWKMKLNNTIYIKQ